MSYINIPSLNFVDLNFKIIYKNNNNSEDIIFISNSLHHYLSNIKKQIDMYTTYWDYYKKITNPYEFIHTQVPNIKQSICKYKPLSRSFFKMIEIINIFSFLNEKNSIKSFHLAEGPGGFIEAFNYKRDNNNDKFYGMTLISDDVNIPSWKKSTSFVNTNKKVIIEYADSKTGDVFLKQNLLYCYNKYVNSMDYITADGGFDFSVDFNKQEDLSTKLIIAQIFFAIIMQKKNGNFILKIFDIFKIKTVEIIFLLTNLYDYVYIYKPYTSRVANSEKYIVCKNYKFNNININNIIIDNFDEIINNIDNIYSLFNISMPKFFLKKLEEINAIYGQQQIENINTTLNIIREYINIKYNNYNYDDTDTDNTYKKFTNDLDVSKSFIYNYDNNNHNNHNNNNDISYNFIFDNFNFLNIEENVDIYKNIDMNSHIDKDIYNSNKISVSYDKFNNKINVLKNINIQKSINWCNKYNFSINKCFFNN